MKKIFKSMWAVAVAAMAFTSCSDNDALDANSEVEKVTINITAGSDVQDPETRTHLDGTAQVKWDAEGEALRVIEKTNKMTDAATNSATVSKDGLTAQFTVQLPKNTSAKSYDYYAIYPAANFINSSNDALNHFKMELPQKQSPVAGSFDPKADLLVSKKVTTTTQATDLNFNFTRPITIVQLQLMGIAKDEKISSVVFENTTKDLAGRLYYDWSTNKVTEFGYANQGSKSISLNCGDQVATGTDDVYFTSFPAELTDFTVTVNTDKATYTKTVDKITAGKLSFKAGHKANIRVSNMTREEKVLDTYMLLTGDNVKLLTEGSKLIITNGNTGSVNAMGAKLATQNDVGLSSSFKVDTTSTNEVVVNTIPADAQVFTLEGDADNGFLLHSTDGYLTSTKAKDLHFSNTVKDASKWSISATGITCGSIHIRYNSSTNYFRTYTGTSCNDVYAFFKEGTPRTPLATPTNLKATVTEGTNTANVSWDAVANATSYTVTCGQNSQTVTTNSATVQNLPWETTSTISVVANPKEDDVANKSSEPATIDVTVGKNPNEGKAPAVGTVIWSEDWAKCANSSKPENCTSNTNIKYKYGVNGTQIYSSDNYAGGTPPELLLKKNGGSLTASGIVVTGIKTLTLQYSANKTLTVSVKFLDGKEQIVTGGSVSDVAVDKNIYTKSITVPAGAKSMSIEIKNTNSSNARIDDITLKVMTI